MNPHKLTVEDKTMFRVVAQRMVRLGHSIEVIKAYRTLYGLPLLDAKLIVDGLRTETGSIEPVQEDRNMLARIIGKADQS